MKLTKFFASFVAVVSIVGLVSSVAFAGYYPADRPTYTCNGNICHGADHVVFNSFVNNPVVGDERPFFAGSIGGANVQDRMKVKDGDVIVLRAYVHNNADPNKIGEAAALAKNVRVRVLVPTAKQADSNMVAFITADNANPGTINDTMSVYGDKAFNLEYVSGSAKWQTNSGTVPVSDSIVTTGASLGNINGCFQYSGYVTLQVKVKMDQPPVPPTTITVCEIATRKLVTINESDFNSAKYTRDLSVCSETPTPPTPTKPTVVLASALPNTGPEGVALAAAGASGLGAAAYQLYLRRRK